MIGRISRFCTLNNILVDSPTLMYIFSSIGSKFCEFNVGASEFVYNDIEKTMIATAITTTARAAIAITFKSNDQSDSAWYKRQ
jgi:hypothetical protein